jgi:hypothetical protein
VVSYVRNVIFREMYKELYVVNWGIVVYLCGLQMYAGKTYYFLLKKTVELSYVISCVDIDVY